MPDDEEQNDVTEEEEEEEEEDGVEEEDADDLSNSDVCTKYQEASKIVNLALKGLVEQCVPGAKIVDLCQFGSTVIESQSAKLYTKKVKGQVVERGVAFPVCVSVNEVVCNYSPVNSNDREKLAEGDIVKIDLGCHIDGYISVAAHTLIVPSSKDTKIDPATLMAENPATGDVAVAAYNAMLVAANTIVAGAKNKDVTEAMQKVAECYGVHPISSVRMHQIKRYVLDGVKEVALYDPTPNEEQEGEEKVPECTFEQFEVYAVDVCMSTGDGKAKPGELRTTVYKRNVEVNYKLKMKASRAVLSEVDKKFPTMPFTLRHFEDEKQAKMGVTECVQHGLLTPYPTLHERKGVKVAHFKCTVLLLPSGTARVTGLELPEYFKTEKEPTEEIGKILAEIAEKEAKRKAKAAKKKAKKKKN